MTEQNTPAVPSPAALAGLRARRTAPVAAAPHPHSDSARFGRVDDEGHVFVRDGESEIEVGSYPGASADEALQYFARKYDELDGAVSLVAARFDNPDVTAKELTEAVAHLREQVAGARVVGDLPALRARVDALDSGLEARREAQAQARAEARAQAAAEREAIVAAAERLAAQPEGSTQWKRTGEQMRDLLEQWKAHQRTSARLDKTTENDLWHRFTVARNTFDKARRSYFAALDQTRGQARAEKSKLVAEAQALAGSTDWGPTARAFRSLMDQWRRAGRAARGDDDALWTAFKEAQDTFFTAMDAATAAADEEFRANLAVKEALLVEAEALLPIQDLEAAKGALRVLQEKWDAAGKVPRADIDRIEKRMRRVEATVREAEERKWKASNPEVAARASSMVAQLTASLESLRSDLAKAQAAGKKSQAESLEARITTQEQWLAQASAGLEEFGTA